MLPNVTLQLVDGVRVVVPDSLELMTTYVLREQQDWFEDEIKFLRRLIEPGQKVIDIGANQGVYALTLAKLVGPTGRVWAFEPASGTAALLAASIGINDFKQVVLVRSAVSNAPGVAQLSVHAQSEMNGLTRGEAPATATESVDCVTLDDSMESLGWQGIDFIKIDAEGEEANILRGGEKFLAAHSPLIQYEIKAGEALHLELVRSFSQRGYQSFRLVPGLDLLVPFDERTADGYLLNLFCCKPDRAARLAARGFLLEPSGAAPSAQAHAVGAAPGWRAALAEFPYGRLLDDAWSKHMDLQTQDEVTTPLAHYARSRDASLPKAERFASLEASFLEFTKLCAAEPIHLRLSSLARVALDYGARTAAVRALERLCIMIFQQKQLSLVEPFLAPSARFDHLAPQSETSAPTWIGAAAAEELERSQYFSSFFSGKASLRRLEIIRDLGFGSAEMQRRLRLIEQRFGTRPAA